MDISLQNQLIAHHNGSNKAGALAAPVQTQGAAGLACTALRRLRGRFWVRLAAAALNCFPANWYMTFFNLQKGGLRHLPPGVDQAGGDCVSSPWDLFFFLTLAPDMEGPLM